MAAKSPELKTTRVPLKDLERWPGNARRGIVSGIKESMRVNGVFQPLIVQKSTNRIIAGNHRYDALTELHEEQPDEWDGHADVIFMDVNDNRALKMNLADNKTSDDATWDDRALLDQLQSIIEDGDDLAGTGFAPDEIDDLETRLSDATDDEWGDALSGVADGDPTVATRTFSFPAKMSATVDDAIDKAKNYTVGDGNANGEAFVHLCQEFLDARG